MNMYLLRVNLFAILLLVAGTVTSQGQEYKTEHRKYPVPEHGELAIDVPVSWEVNYVSLSETKPAIITFYESNKSGGQIFQLNVSILWDDGFIRDITSPEHIRNMVEDSGEKLLQYSRESSLDLVQIDGAAGTGFYFDLTDANPLEDEFKFLTQGAIGVGEVVLIFSLFTNDRTSGHREKALAMVKSARHELQRHVYNLIQTM